MKENSSKKLRNISNQSSNKRITKGTVSTTNQTTSILNISVEDKEGSTTIINISRGTALSKVKLQILQVLAIPDQSPQFAQQVRCNQDGYSSFRSEQKIKQIWFEDLDKDFLFDYRFQKQIGCLDKKVRLLVHGFLIKKTGTKVQRKKQSRNYIVSSQNQNRRLSNKKNRNRSQQHLQNRKSKNSSLSKTQKVNQAFPDKFENKSTVNNLSKYKLLRCISVGGFSKVYLARSLQSGDFFAAKFIDKAKNKGQNADALIYNERDINKLVDHPSIVKMEEFIQTDNFFIFIMEYCPGGELFHQLKNFSTITEDQAKIYFIEVLLAVQHLHKMNIVFRDVKPQNILLNEQGHVKLTDFGLAKILPKRQRTYSYCGSVQYMAPQIILNQGHGMQVDFYCMGILLYEIMVGCPPFYDSNATPQQIKSSIIMDEVFFPQDVILSQQIRDLILKLLRKQPKKRLGFYGGVRQIIMHPWIKRIDTAQYLQRKIDAPLKPSLDILNFDESQFGQSEIRFSNKVALQLRRLHYEQKKKEKKEKSANKKFQDRKYSYSESKYHFKGYEHRKSANKLIQYTKNKNRGMSFQVQPKQSNRLLGQKMSSYLSPIFLKTSAPNNAFSSIQQKFNYKSYLNSESYLLKKKDKVSVDLIRKLYGVKRDLQSKKDTRLRKVGKPERQKENRPFFKANN